MTLDEFDAVYAGLAGGGIDSATYAHLCTLSLDLPQAQALAGLDPFSPAYKAAALELYFFLRDREHGYDPVRDEASGLGAPADVWTQVTPWSFRDPAFSAEFFFSWGHILQALGIGMNAGLSVLEYGPGSGQLLLFLARMGVETYGVDIDQAILNVVATQARHMGLGVQLEAAGFGDGFTGRTFDRILFFEAFHHAVDFLELIPRLRERLSPGGRLVFAGEPVVAQPIPSIPYPWGPRLDALSVFCIRRNGWMELGFSEAFFTAALTRAGLDVTVMAFPGCGRATAYVASVAQGAAQVRHESFGAPAASAADAELTQALHDARARADAADARVAALLASTSWRMTSPLRRLAGGLRRGS